MSMKKNQLQYYMVNLDYYYRQGFRFQKLPSKT